jgi:hypothetical protein
MAAPDGGRPASGNLLVVYGLYQWPLRSTVEDHLYAFRRHSGRRCFYFNALADEVTPQLLRRRYDAIVFHTTFLSSRWSPEVFARALEAARPLKDLDAVSVALPQDEYLHSEILSAFYEEFAIDVVGSVGPESEWSKLYPAVDRSRVRFHRFLTGYLEEDTLERIQRIVAQTPARDLDIGYRAWKGAYWLGRHGMRLDISTRDEDTLWRDDWFRFLARCRYTIGIEGGASVHDPDGAVRDRVDAYIAEHPDADFDEVEAECFAGQDGALTYFALSPRHLEACATRTCQVLIEGDYNGILRPWEHYIPLKADLSDLGAALDLMADEERRQEMVDRAHRDVVASGAFTYRSFVRELEAETIGADVPVPAPRPADLLALGVNRVRDRVVWLRIAYALGGARRLSPLVARAVGLAAFLRRPSAAALVERLRWSRPAAVLASAVPAPVKARLRGLLARRPS